MVKLSKAEIDLYKEKGFVVPNLRVSDEIIQRLREPKKIHQEITLTCAHSNWRLFIHPKPVQGTRLGTRHF